MKRSFDCFFLLLISISVFSQSFAPVNKHASAEAKQLLSYLYSINGKQLLSGQHNFNHDMNSFNDSVYAITGKYPAVWGTDFIWNWKTDNGQAIVDECIRRNKEGFIITLMWHQGRPIDDAPFRWKESIQGKLTDEQWKELTTEGTPLYNRWLAQIDVVAGYLEQLNAAHVPVLWRPYHEMNGIWFWWGNRKGKDGIAKLWSMMYDRYVNHFHLNNLLWVWGANGPRDIPGDEAYAYKDFYPGAAFVDVLGTDVYHMDYEQRDYNELLDLAHGKLIALTECGELPGAAILDAQPKWSWFLVWADWIYNHNSREQVRAVYDRGQTLTHDEIVPDSILAQMRYAAKEGLLDKYYPRNIDTLYGGYLSTFSYDFKPVGPQDKMIVTQARHTWSTAKAALFYRDSTYIAMSRHGFYFLRDKMWDAEYGGFYNLVTREGVVKSKIKEAYGNAFAIYALSAYYECSGDTAALGLARRGFMWLEKHSHDPVFKGYYQHLERDGTPVKRTAAVDSRAELGYKDQNSSIHLLEAFTELYHVWPDPLVRERLQEMLVLIRDRIVTSRGYLQLFFTIDWQPVTYRDSSEEAILRHKNLDHVSFGHDVETAYLLQEAAEALGLKDDKATLAIGKKMVDHALVNGWDDALGGFYDEGYYFKDKAGCTIINRSKNWWAQAEGLNTLLIFSALYPNDPMHYRERFIRLWQYVQTYMIDHEYGDWYEEGLDNEPQRRTALKAHIWKGTYHNFRSLSNCIRRLSELRMPRFVR